VQAPDTSSDAGNDHCQTVEKADETQDARACDTTEDEESIGEDHVCEVKPPELGPRVTAFKVCIIFEKSTSPVRNDLHEHNRNRLCDCASGLLLNLPSWHL